MAKFLKGNDLNAELEKLFEKAESLIILISPYIKLHERYCSTLLTKLNNPDLEITIVFGKNEKDISMSMKQEDFEFFKKFPNIEILYEKRLHAKYYANEKTAILSSMNLYGYSQNNNIEAGILIEKTFGGSFTGDNDLDNNSWNYFSTVLDQSEKLFEKRPIFEKKNFLSSTKYVESEIIIDNLSDFFANKQYTKVNKNQKETIRTTNNKNIGFCIRTGVEIPFNLEKPLSLESFKLWNKYKDRNFPEKYCHFSGEKSNGNTSVEKPILNKYWNIAKEKYNLQ